ncbi:divergent polysaccharide deacetylase family protein [Polycladidibacter stylochi]|uniref:divergent polysaccharide deacetylase family protein n=1 Tax=Polycladidibacter stylochi TaxID=1807766 RepID=UPI00082FA79A|nr:divergent polysaccharide deacetylase family protein [Pseudovibrio stylochi]
MAGDDLRAPLGKTQKGVLLRLPYGLIGLTIITLVLVTGFIWTNVVDDPLGGEPTAVVSLNYKPDGISRNDIGIVDLGDGANQPLSEAAIKAASAYGEGHAPAPTSLSQSPNAELVETGPYGLLPKVSAKGLQPLREYARPAPAANAYQARIAIVVSGIGQSAAMSDIAINDLPRDITLALSPYGEALGQWVSKARRRGHELLLQVPLEPFDFPSNDAGPQSLLVNNKAADNVDRLHWVLSRATNYVGLINFMGGRFLSKELSLQALMKETHKRGLMFMDDGNANGSQARKVARNTQVPFIGADLVLDSELNSEDIGAQLLELESIARRKGIAVASATAFPITLKELKRWSQNLEARGLKLIPISAALNKPQ